VRLTEHFTLDEFEHSQTASRIGIDNRVPAHLIDNLQRLARVLQHIRDFLGEPVVISSGYRSPELNRRVGGSPTSHHRYAAAADWTCPAFGTPLECAVAIEPHVELWGITQLIAEFATADGRGWVHTGILPVQPPNQIISIDRLGTRVGLHPAR
jgi:zinc D-Ala-D-Ala carboxypeptidase